MPFHLITVRIGLFLGFMLLVVSGCAAQAPQTAPAVNLTPALTGTNTPPPLATQTRGANATLAPTSTATPSPNASVTAMQTQPAANPAAQEATATTIARVVLQISPSVTPLPVYQAPLQPDAAAAAKLAPTPTAISLVPASLTEPDNDSQTQNGTAASGTPRGSGSPATRLVIAKIALDVAIKPAASMTYQIENGIIADWNIPYDAAGHLETTAQPGEIGNAVLSGHHNLVAPEKFGRGQFADLWNLAKGDRVQVTTRDGKTQTWRVTDSFPIKEGGEPLDVRIQHTQQILNDTPAPTLTLLTCWNGQANPFSGNTYRWIVQAELASIH